MTAPTGQKAPLQHLAQADRQAVLLAAVLAEGGIWTTARVRRTYALAGVAPVYRSSLRADLAALNRAGHLTVHDTKRGRFFTATSGGAA